MSITATFAHKLADDFEQYTFTSNVNPKQRHYIDRDNDGPWKLGLVQLEESLSLEELQELRIELAELYAFMIGLNSRELCRRTGPGQPEHNGIGGGL